MIPRLRTTFAGWLAATLRKSIKFEAGRYVPNSPEDSYIEFEILGQADEDNMSVLIVASPREIVESRVRACELAGIEVEIVDVEAFAAAYLRTAARLRPALASPGERYDVRRRLCSDRPCAAVDAHLLRDLEEAVNTPGGFTAQGRAGLLVVSPYRRRVFFVGGV